MRIEKLRKAHGLRIKWVHFPLHPETPQEGRSLEDLFAGRGYDIPKMQAQMRARMVAEGLPYGTRTHTYNSRLAQELAAWADTQPGGEAINLQNTTFFLSRETIIATSSPGMSRLRKRLFALMSRNAQPATQFFSLPANRVVELGMQLQL